MASAALGGGLFVAGDLLSVTPQERLLVAGGPPFRCLVLSTSSSRLFPAGSLAMARALMARTLSTASCPRLLVAVAGILLAWARALLHRTLLFAAGALLRMTWLAVVCHTFLFRARPLRFAAGIGLFMVPRALGFRAPGALACGRAAVLGNRRGGPDQGKRAAAAECARPQRPA